MIQRIQSVYLLLTTLVSLLFFKGSILTFHGTNDSVIRLTIWKLIRVTGSFNNAIIESSFIPAIAVILVSTISVMTIFLFRKRMLQLRVTIMLIVLVLLSFVGTSIYAYYIITTFKVVMSVGASYFIPAIQFILLILAYRAIKKDDDLVKSYDRLR